MSANGMNATPSGNSGASSPPSSTTMRVLPTPPGPVIVTTRCSRTSSTSDARSAARPSTGADGRGRLAGSANRSPLPVSAAGSGTTSPSASTAQSSNGRPTFFSLNCPRRTTVISLRFLIWSYAASDSSTPPGTAKDSIRAAMFTASPVRRSGSMITSPTWRPIRTWTSCAASSCWMATAACTAASELGNMLMLPSPSRCTIVPPQASWCVSSALTYRSRLSSPACSSACSRAV